MKYIKEHVMFIFPMLAILLGIESFIVFDRMSENYEKDLKSDYSMLVLTTKPMDLSMFQSLDNRISSSKIIEKKSIVDKMIKGMNSISADDIMQALPYFYRIGLGSYLDQKSLEEIKSKLIVKKEIKRVETFGKTHDSNYNLFVFIKIVLWTFVSFMTLTSLFLVIKQMQIWQYAHKERMQVMEIFGASTMLKSGILFKRAIIDAIIATFITATLFAFLRFIWVKKSSIEKLMENESLLFTYQDIAILGGIALFIVITAVMIVVMTSKERDL